MEEIIIIAQSLNTDATGFFSLASFIGLIYYFYIIIKEDNAPR